MYVCAHRGACVCVCKIKFHIILWLCYVARLFKSKNKLVSERKQSLSDASYWCVNCHGQVKKKTNYLEERAWDPRGNGLGMSSTRMIQNLSQRMKKQGRQEKKKGGGGWGEERKLFFLYSWWYYYIKTHERGLLYVVTHWILHQSLKLFLVR